MTRRICLICMTNRTGSSWLRHMMMSAGIPDVYEEPGQHDLRERWAANQHRDPYPIVVTYGWLLRVFVLMAPAERKAARYVYLTREDTWRQAISEYRMQESGLCHLWADRLQDTSKHRAVPYDAAKIVECWRHVSVSNTRWERWFRAMRIDPLRITYEEMCECPLAITAMVLKHFDLTATMGIDIGTLRITRDEITEEWIKRLEADGWRE